MNDKPQSAVDLHGKWILRVGGISSIVLGIGYLLTIPVMTIFAGGFPPPGVEARLAFFAQHATGWWIATALMIVTDLLYVPVFLALFQSLKDFNRYLMLLALACEGLFVVLDLALTWPTYSTLITLGSSYAVTDDVQRAMIISTAGYPSMLIDSPLAGIYVILFPGLGLLLTSLVMFKGVFSKPLSYLGLAAGVCGILAGIGPIFMSQLETFQYINASLAMIWFFFAGLKLNKLGRQTN